MEFGKLAEIKHVDWNIPRDDGRNKLKPVSQLKVFIGATTWSNKHWRGKIYPVGSPEETFLYHYSRQFNCLEFNTSFYRIPTPEITREWISHVPEGFEFCPKVYKGISHSRFGMGDKNLLREWFIFLGNLKDKLGPAFIQFHEEFSYAEKESLFHFLQNWPQEFKLTLEFRHPSWYKDHTILPALAEYLQKRGMGLVITDVAGRRDVLHTSLSSNWTLIRLIGNNLDPSDELRLRNWGTRLVEWQRQGLESIYLMLHQPEDIWTIEFAKLAHQVLAQSGVQNIPVFESIQQGDLFK